MKKWLRRLKKDERGLTLVELLAVVVILAIVGAIAFVLIGNVIDNAKKDAHVANAQQLIASAKLYEANGEEIGDGVSSEELQTKELLGELFDPWTKKSEGYEGTVTKIEGEKSGYKVTLDDNEGNCTIDATETKLVEDGRELCGETN